MNIANLHFKKLLQACAFERQDGECGIIFLFYLILESRAHFSCLIDLMMTNIASLGIGIPLPGNLIRLSTNVIACDSCS